MPKKTEVNSLEILIKKYLKAESKGDLTEKDIKDIYNLIDKEKRKTKPTVLAKLYFLLYNYYRKTSDTEKFHTICIALIPILESNKDNNRLGKVYLDFGINYRILGKYDESYEYLQKSLTIYEKTNDIIRIGVTLNSIANYYYEKGELNEAFENYYKAFEHVKAYVNNEAYHIIKHNLAHIYLILNYYSKAKNLYVQDLKTLKENNNTERYAASLQGISEVYLEEKRIKLAYKYIKLAVDEWKKSKNERGIASALATFGYTLSQFNKYDEALKYYGQSLKILEKISYKIELVRLHFHIGNTYYDLKKYKLSVENLEKAETLAISIKQNFELRKVYNKLFEAYEALGNQNKAYITVKKLKELNDRLFNFNLRAKINEVQINFELEKKELAYSKERELNEYKNNLFSYITHEFRTPLTLINTPLELILNDSNIDTIKERIPSIVTHIHHMQHLLNQLLDINKIEEGVMPILKKVGSINSLIWHIIHVFETEMIEKGIAFNYILPKKKIHGYFDSDKIHKIVSNLLSNSVKYINTDGEINLTVELNNEELTIIVEDNGIGIDKKYHKDIFSKFYRIPSENDVKGSGLGLSFVKELTTLLGGTIQLNSEPNKGSKFTVILPFENIDQVSTKFKSVQEIEKPNDAEDEKKTHTVLVVEDNIEIQKLIKELFSKNFKVIVADHGREAIAKINKKIPDIVISDIMMPLMNGIDLCKYIKDDANLNHIPVILLTAKSQSIDKIEGLESGADAYITKPFNIEVLLHTVQSMIEQRKKIMNKFSKNVFNFNDEEMISADVVFINQATEYIMENIETESLSVSDLASFMNMSRFTLIRRFKSIQSMTPNNFIQKIRLEKSKELLRNKVANVSEIAFMVGFSSTTYFSYSFKKEYGITPKEFYNTPT